MLFNRRGTHTQPAKLSPKVPQSYMRLLLGLRHANAPCPLRCTRARARSQSIHATTSTQLLDLRLAPQNRLGFSAHTHTNTHTHSRVFIGLLTPDTHDLQTNADACATAIELFQPIDAKAIASMHGMFGEVIGERPPSGRAHREIALHNVLV